MIKVIVLVLQLMPYASDDNALDVLNLDGQEMHKDLHVVSIDGEKRIRHIPSELISSNPYQSNDPVFVKTIARAGSQGNLQVDGMVAALYAFYQAEKDLGFYGLEAATESYALTREQELRRIWAHNMKIDRVRIYRRGLVLLVIWHDGVSPEIWNAVNETVEQRLKN